MRGKGGHAWQGSMHGGGGVHGQGRQFMVGGMCGRRDGHCSGWYASYWNAFLSTVTSIACKW